MATGLTGTEILLFTESQSTLRHLVAERPNLTPGAVFAIINEHDCYRQWIQDLAGSRSRYARLMSRRLDTAFSGFVGPILASQALMVLRTFQRSVENTRFNSRVRMFSSFTFVTDDLAHVSTDDELIPLFDLLTALSRAIKLLGDFVVGSMNPTRMIDMALATDAVTIAGPEAIKRFNNQLENGITIPYILTSAEKDMVRRELGDDPFFKMTNPLRNDHVVMAALRHAIREAHKRQHRLHNDGQGVKTLVIGAAMREVSEFAALPNVHYYFANADPKDTARTSLEILKELVKQKRANLTSKDKKILAELRRHPKYRANMPVKEAMSVLTEVKRVKKLCGGKPLKNVLGYEELLDQFQQTGGVVKPGTFHYEVKDSQRTRDVNDQYTLLLAQDWGYNATAVNWLELFRRTSAHQCLGYMALPLELLFEDMPESDFYRFRRFKRKLLFDNHLASSPVDPQEFSPIAQVCTGHTSIDWASLTHAYSNGYSHPVSTWGLLLRHPVISHHAYDFALEVQLENRYGPMVSFSLTRVAKQASIVRTIALPAHNRYVKLLDLPALAKQMAACSFMSRAKLPLQYFSVHADEFYTTLAYAQAMDIQSLNRKNLATFVKVHRAGASLVSKELKPKWFLKPEDIYKFVQAVYYYAMYLHTQLASEIDDIIKIDISWRDRLLAMATKGIHNILYSTKWMWSWLVSEQLVEKLLIVMPDSFDQEGCSGLQQVRHIGHMYDKGSFSDKVDYSGDLALTSNFVDSQLMPEGYTIDEWLREEEVIVRAVYREKIAEIDPATMVTVTLPDPDVTLLNKYKAGFRIKTDQDFHAALRDYHKEVKRSGCECGLCIQLGDTCGEQIVDCFYQRDSDVELCVTLDELNVLKEQMREEARVAPTGLKDTLEAAMKEIPGADIRHTVRIEYIKGGPGTGKSRLIRELADNVRDLIVAPFQKLRVDYKDQPTADGTLMSWEFHTQHRAMTIKNREKIFVDEFTAVPYALLAIIAYNCQAKTIVLVGDEQQTGVLEGNNEGTPIMKMVDLGKVSMHNLLCNFRNPVHDVHKINYLYGTRMLPMSKVESGLSFDDLATVPNKVAVEGFSLMHFSWETCRNLFGEVDKEKKTSVRCNQGSTHKKVVLPITEADKHLIQQDALSFVALTRHRDQLVVLFDPVVQGSEVRAFQQRLTTFPDDVLDTDYVTSLAFDVAKSAKEPLYGFGETTRRFIAITKSVGGYEPAGIDADAFTAVQDDIVTEDIESVVRERIFETQCLKTPGCTFQRLQLRKNICLIEAVAEALDCPLESLHNELESSLWYRKWIMEDSLATRADCENLSAALKLKLVVNFTTTACRQAWEFAPVGFTRTVAIMHEENERGGHFYVDATATQAMIATQVFRQVNEARCARELKKVNTVDFTSDEVMAYPVDPANTVAAVSSRTMARAEEVFGSLTRTLFDRIGLGETELQTPLLPGLPSDSAEASSSSSFDFAGGAQVELSQQKLYSDNFGLRKTFVDYATEFVPAVPVSYLMPTDADLKLLATQKHPQVRPIYDAFRMINEYEFQNVESYDVPYINHEMANVVGEKFVAGQLSVEFQMPMNIRRHPKAQSQKFFTMGAGPALMYFKGNPAQQLQVLQARYLGRRAKDLPTFRRTQLANHVADLFVDECMEPAMDVVMSLENLYSITSKGFADMVKKHYQKQMDENDTRNARVYRFQLKDIEKPFKDAIVDLGKAGQGILAWSKEAHVMFMLAFRVLNDLLLKSLKPWVVYDNSMSEEQFLDKVNAAMTVTPDCAVNSVIDATACDSGQNGFTQLIERQIYARLGASELLLDWYFSFREKYILQAEHVRAPMENVKTSGEPGTLLGNSILMAAILNALVRGSGPFVLVMKGDDGFKRQACPKYDAEMLMGIKSFCPLDFKIDIDVPISFCGYALVEGALYPDVQRKLAKVRTHRFRNFSHFAEYQTSLRDWLSRVPFEPEAYMRFLAVNAELSGRSVEQVEHMIMMIQSVTHIGARQFQSCFHQVTVEFEPMPHHFKDLDPTVVSQKLNTTFLPAENYAKRVMAKLKYNLK
nr:replication-associated protein [Wheat stripe mosaic virus]